MASASPILIISSDEEDDDVVVIREVRASRPCVAVKREVNHSGIDKNDFILIMDSPLKVEKAEVRINKAKLKSLRKSASKDRFTCKPNHVPNAGNSPRRDFKINKARLKKLKAIVKIQLGIGRASNVKEEKMDICQDFNVETAKYFLHSPTRAVPSFNNFSSPTRTQSLLTNSQSPAPPQLSRTEFQSPVQTPPAALDFLSHRHSPDTGSPARNLFQSSHRLPSSEKKSPGKYLRSSPKRPQSPSKLECCNESTADICSRPAVIASSVAGPQKPSSQPGPSKQQPCSMQAKLKKWLTPTKKTRSMEPVMDIDMKPVTAKRNEVVWPPSQVILKPNEFVQKLYKPPAEFSASYNDIIEGLQDEHFLFSVVRTIRCLMSSSLAPPSTLIRYLVKDVLLDSCKPRLSYATYCLLSEVHARFPASCLAMRVEWKDLEKLVEQVAAVSTNGEEQLQFLSASLALSFSLTVLSSEVKSVALKSKPTRIKKVFSADCDIRNMKEIVVGVKVCVSNHTKACGYGMFPASAAPESVTPSSGNTGLCSVELLQSMLKFVTVTSSNKENVAIRVANELMSLYMDLPSLEARILLLQTLKSHLVRRYLIEVLLMNYCTPLPDALPGNEVAMSARKIVLQDFHRAPPSRSPRHDALRRSVSEIEEYVTLLAYLLQSYVAMHSPALQCCHGDFALYKADQVKQFSEEDERIFRDLRVYTINLRKSCEGFLHDGQCLSLRTELLLEMMASVV